MLIAANRDEMRDRPWDPPGRHWPDRPEVVAGRDRLAGGSWLGRNDHGVVAAALNREGSLGPAQGKRSRGELVLEALDHADASAAAAALQDVNPDAYRTFNMIVADNAGAFWISNRADAGRIQVEPISEGLSMLTSGNLNDMANPRVSVHLPRFRAAPAPDPDRQEWSSWIEILATREYDASGGPGSAMCIGVGNGYGFGTVSSSLIALAAPGVSSVGGTADRWLFAPGPPDRTEYRPVAL
jgi:uncharacterized protein with NRDE domain